MIYSVGITKDTYNDSMYSYNKQKNLCLLSKPKIFRCLLWLDINTHFIYHMMVNVRPVSDQWSKILDTYFRSFYKTNRAFLLQSGQTVRDITWWKLTGSGITSVLSGFWGTSSLFSRRYGRIWMVVMSLPHKGGSSIMGAVSERLYTC